MDQVKPPEPAPIRQRFVANIQNRAIVLHPLETIIHDEVGALAELKRDGLLSSRELRTEQICAAGADPARAAEQNPNGQKREQ